MGRLYDGGWSFRSVFGYQGCHDLSISIIDPSHMDPERSPHFHHPEERECQQKLWHFSSQNLVNVAWSFAKAVTSNALPLLCYTLPQNVCTTLENPKFEPVDQLYMDMFNSTLLVSQRVAAMAWPDLCH